jgi:cytochrome c biogenesis protein CcmG/thiol:disulfide interchange protein DsbE
MKSRFSRSSIKQVVFLIVLVIAVVLLVVGFLSKHRENAGKIITNGDRAPEFRLPNLNGQIINLSDFRGRVVMIHFWATWCPPCVEEIPELADLNQQLAGSDFTMLAVSVDEGGAPAVNSFLQQKGLNLPVLLDPDRTTAGRYGTLKFPETYLLDREGIVRYKIIGPGDWRDPAVIKIIKDLMSSR